MKFESLTILPGNSKAGEPEHFAQFTLHPASSAPLQETQGLERAAS